VTAIVVGQFNHFIQQKLGERSFSSKAITCTHIHTHTPDRLQYLDHWLWQDTVGLSEVRRVKMECIQVRASGGESKTKLAECRSR